MSEKVDVEQIKRENDRLVMKVYGLEFENFLACRQCGNAAYWTT